MQSKPRSRARTHRHSIITRRLAVCASSILLGAGVASDAFAGDGSLSPEEGTVNLTVMFRYLPSQADIDAITTTIEEASAILCDATEGQVRLGNVKLRANLCEKEGCQVGVDAADVVVTWTNDVVRANADACGGQGQPCIALGTLGKRISINRPVLTKPNVLAHELGHYVLNLKDSAAEPTKCETSHRPPYGAIFTCDEIMNGDGTATSLMMADTCGSDDDIYSELTTQATLPELGQSSCVAQDDLECPTACLEMYSDPYDGNTNDDAIQYPACQAYDPGTCTWEWPGAYWWSMYKFGEVLSEMDQAALTLQTVNGGVPFFQTVTTGVPIADAPDCEPPTIEDEIEMPDQMMLVLDRSYSMAFPNSDFEKCDPVDGCPEICDNGQDDDDDPTTGDTDTTVCKPSRLEGLKSFTRIFVDLMASAEEGIETGLMSFACDDTLDLPLTVPTSSNGATTFWPPIDALEANGSTAIVDTLYDAAAQLDGANKAIFLVSDGINTCGDDDLSAAIETLKEDGTRVYALSFGPGFASGETLRVAGETNGRYLGVERTNELGPAFARQWASFVGAGQIVPQLPYRLNRQSSGEGRIMTQESWLKNEAPPSPPPKMARYDVWVEPETRKLMVLLASDHDHLSGFGLRAKLVGPAGTNPSTFDTTIPSSLMKVTRRDGYMLLELRAPNPGKWQVQLTVPALATTKALQSGYITVLSRSPNATLATDISRTVVDDPTGGVIVEAYPRWDGANLFAASVQAFLVAPDGTGTALEVLGGKEPTEGYRVEIPEAAIAMEGLYEVRLRLEARPPTAKLSFGEWIPDTAMPVRMERTASESFVVLPRTCPPPRIDCR